MIGRVVAGVSSAYLLARGMVLLANLCTQPSLRARRGAASAASAKTAAGAPRVTLLIPARDEAETFRVTMPGFLAQGAHEVVVLDDESADATRSLAEEAGARVLAGTPRPDGWTGKNWACAQLAEAAGAAAAGSAHAVAQQPNDDVLIFTDADVRWNPGALDALLTTMRATRADLLTVFPRQEAGTLGERLVTPLNDAVVLGSVPVALQHRRAPVVANGQVMAFTRGAYERIGGHAAVRGELVEDMRLAERMRAAGGRVVVARGGTAIGVRMYDGYRSSVRGFAKSLLGLHRGSRALMAATSLLTLCVYTAPWVLLLLARRGQTTGGAGAGGGTARLLHIVRVAGLLDRALVNVVTGRRGLLDLAEGLLGPISPLLVLPVYALAGRRRVSWKGREYPA
ncbi:glycosyltransferase [Pseudoclavibacter helvolus]|uniref:glycosyltransferase n=1 Tax=Pseudoclavibacter helvolus TaxID=255205 RepID=UPI003C77FC9A